MLKSQSPFTFKLQTPLKRGMVSDVGSPAKFKDLKSGSGMVSDVGFSLRTAALVPLIWRCLALLRWCRFSGTAALVRLLWHCCSSSTALALLF